MGGGGAGVKEFFSTTNLKIEYIFFFGGGGKGEGGGVRVSECFLQRIRI